jgi:brefeldin A-inhibited guanine nucleotide-exchange protein
LREVTKEATEGGKPEGRVMPSKILVEKGRPEEDHAGGNAEGDEDASIHTPRNGFFSPHDGPVEGYRTSESEGSRNDEPPPIPEKDDGQPSERRSPGLRGTDSISNGTRPQSLGPEGRSSSLPIASARRYSAISSMLFVTTALESIGASKEARKRKGLGDSVQTALSAIRQDSAPDPEVIFEPLRLATETPNILLTTTSLDCIGKLITYSYFSMPITPTPTAEAPEKPQTPLIERAIDTICDCFQDEATPAEVQLQIVKSLLAAVLNDKIIVHGAGLLKAVRQVYNIFLLSRSGANQQVAQGTLTQMVGTVFERVKIRLARKESRSGVLKFPSGRGTANGSQEDLNGGSSGADPTEIESIMEPDGSVDATSIVSSDRPAGKDFVEKLTLKDFENAKNFEDTIGDNEPTMVTRANSQPRPTRTTSGTHHDIQFDPEYADEEEEDEIFVKDAFLVFRSMCRLSTKILPQEQLSDLRSQNMRSKLISLAIIRTLLNNNMEVFISPLVTIRGSVSNEPTSFGQAVNQYLRLALSRNGASSVRQVFETSCEIFWLMLKDMRIMLKVSLDLPRFLLGLTPL